MTSVGEVLKLSRGDAGLRAVPAPRALRAVPDTVVAPRATTVLEQRRRWERHYRMLLHVTDVGMIVLVVGLTVGIQIQLGAAPLDTAVRAGLLCAVWMATLSGTHTRDSALFRPSVAEYRGVAHATGLAFGILAIGDALMSLHGMQLLVVVALPLGLGMLMLSRWSWRRWLLAQRATGGFASRTLVVGNREDVDYVIGSLDDAASAGLRVVGVTLLDGRASAQPAELVIGDGAYPVLGDADTVSDIARDLGTDTIIVASRPQGDPEYVKRLSWQLEGTAAELVLCNRLADVAGPRLSFEPLDGLPLIRMRIPAYSGGQHAVKRVLDVVVAAIALIPIAIALPFLAILIKLDSPGPVFFFQERVGRDGRLFKMVKFRSMHTDAEQQLVALRAQNEGAGLLFKMKDDPRVTRVGRVMRKLSLDELPQFWNVLVGDMSVVGPRPPLTSEVGAYDGSVFRRLYIKPGITGLWQVSGRSDLSWDESVRLDLRYVENWSVVSDLQIMWRTAKVMVRPTGAY
ncbi:sugar transferase [Microbacterium sp. YJN-G]|uniref:sugar transferase n=1 Tax=Microbacterium sp. YJN-G TaxID=2763257 RepID=UPI001878E5CF|nr:sugar transferase [Microbacterium sp. YJN-G]